MACFCMGSVRAVSSACCLLVSGVNSRAMFTFSSNWLTVSQPMMTVLTGWERVQYMASRMLSVPGLVEMTAWPSHECCCFSTAGGSHEAVSYTHLTLPT